jgi:shikimate dehydrogenase
MGVPYAEVIGDPVAHSKSPLIHKFWLERAGMDGHFRQARVPSEALADFIAERRSDPDWRGCSVTIPHKAEACRLVDNRTWAARRTGAVNAVAARPDGLLGDNTDYHALRHELLPHAENASLLGNAAIVIGAGGAARAVVAVLRDVEELEIVLVNRTAAKAEALLEEFQLSGRVLPLGGPWPASGLIVNASSLGMTGFPALPLEAADLSGATVVDMVYAPVETELLKRAREMRLLTVDGLTLLIGQAKLAFEHFFRQPPPFDTEVELRRLLTS